MNIPNDLDSIYLKYSPTYLIQKWIMCQERFAVKFTEDKILSYLSNSFTTLIIIQIACLSGVFGLFSTSVLILNARFWLFCAFLWKSNWLCLLVTRFFGKFSLDYYCLLLYYIFFGFFFGLHSFSSMLICCRHVLKRIFLLQFGFQIVAENA